MLLFTRETLGLVPEVVHLTYEHWENINGKWTWRPVTLVVFARNDDDAWEDEYDDVGNTFTDNYVKSCIDDYISTIKKDKFSRNIEIYLENDYENTSKTLKI